MNADDRKFEFLLNAMENAAAQRNPAAHDYGQKRKAVFAYVAQLEADRRDAERLDEVFKMSIATIFRLRDCCENSDEWRKYIDRYIAVRFAMSREGGEHDAS